MKKIRVAGIIPMEDGIALMHRKEVLNKSPMTNYYTFPGGGLEENETLEEGTIREIKEEFGIDVDVVEKLYECYTPQIESKEYFFLCKYISGKFGTGTGPEFSNDPKYKDSGKYIPEIVKKQNIKNILLVPKEIKEKLLIDIEKNRI